MNFVNHPRIYCQLIAITLSTSMLSGCSTFSPPKQVNIPVQVPCVTSNVAKPDYTFDASKGKSLGEQVRALLVDRQLSIGYQAKLEAIVAGCL